MELSEIEAFLTIQQVGGFTKAAEALHLSQPAISRRIELLERELGVPLFERLANGVSLSEAGRAFLPYARQVLAALEDGRAAVRALEDEEQGNIRLALVGTLASTQLTKHLQRFRRAYPRIHVTLHTARSDEVSTLVLQGQAQLGLRYFTDPHPDILSLLVINEPLRVVSAMQSRFFGAEPATPEDLAWIPWVTFPHNEGSSGEPFARLLARQLLLNNLDTAERIVIDSLTAQKRLIEADFGIGLLPASSIEEELRLGTMRVLPIRAMETTVPVMAIHRRQAYLSRALRLLIERLTGIRDERKAK